jgi:hypothetical protein
VRVKGGLQIVMPPLRQEEQEQGQRGEHRNGLEETMCTMRIRENIGDPSRADVFTPEAGRISTVNSHNLPILRYIQLSAERGVLYNVSVRYTYPRQISLHGINAILKRKILNVC